MEKLDERLSGIDISDWAGVEPVTLLLTPSLVELHPPLEAAARAIRYARATGEADYDEIGFRARAATPISFVGYFPFETFGSVRLDHAREMRSRAAGEIGRVRSEQVLLRHRALDFRVDGNISWRVEGDLINLVIIGSDGSEEIWTYALSHPPDLVRSSAFPSDAAKLVSQQLRVDLPAMRWLPLPHLIEAGRFRRMQEWAEKLDAETAPGRYYAFISHRWLTTGHPDPEGTQAQFVAWQLVAYLCEAIRIARRRGLHEPRLTTKLDPNVRIGPHGSDVAESIIVNVLRAALDDESLAQAAAEAEAIATLTRDNGVTAAASDTSLAELRSILRERAVISSLLGRISVWYDYSCLPQPPRTREDDDLFRRGLETLIPCQILGITLVLLDDAEDYLTRAWCTLEAVVADSVDSIGTLVGSRRATAAGGRTEESFVALLKDRPHLVWRALLDTEVFGVQGFEQCLRRLSLAATDHDDLRFIYKQLRAFGAPKKIHIDDSEIVTGTLPLPAADNGRVLAARPGRAAGEPGPRPMASVDWTGALHLSDSDRTGRHIVVPSWWTRPPRTGSAAVAHVAVLAACEGEAVLVAGWVDSHLPELETVLGMSVGSVSWTASDIAPVGHFTEGALQIRPVEASTWVLVGVRARLTYDPVATLVANTVAATGRSTVRVAIDEKADNVVFVEPLADGSPEPPSDSSDLVTTDPGDLGTLAGGVHKTVLVDVLAGHEVRNE